MSWVIAIMHAVVTQIHLTIYTVKARCIVSAGNGGIYRLRCISAVLIPSYHSKCQRQFLPLIQLVNGAGIIVYFKRIVRRPAVCGIGVDGDLAVIVVERGAGTIHNGRDICNLRPARPLYEI